MKWASFAGYMCRLTKWSQRAGPTVGWKATALRVSFMIWGKGGSHIVNIVGEEDFQNWMGEEANSSIGKLTGPEVFLVFVRRNALYSWNIGKGEWLSGGGSSRGSGSGGMVSEMLSKGCLFRAGRGSTIIPSCFFCTLGAKLVLGAMTFLLSSMQ